jgi:AraC-like DNA-binding protein
MQNKKQKFMNIPFTKQESNNNQIEFQIIDMKTLFEIKPDHNLEEYHKLKFNLIMIVIEGQGVHNIDFETYEYKKGSVLFVKRNQAHSFKINPNLNCYLLQFTDNFLNRLVKDCVYDIFDYMRYPVNMQLDDESLNDILNNINILNHQLKTNDDEFKEPILQSLLQSLLLQLKRKRGKQSTDLKDKDKKMYQDFLNIVHSSHNYSMKVDDYSRKLNISSRTLTNLLNKYTEKSTKTYLNEFLLLEIKRYLLDGSLTIQEIADKLNFDEATNLVIFFKRFEYMTPREYDPTIRKHIYR